MSKRPTDPTASAWGTVGAHLKWSRCLDRTAATAAGRAAAEQRFLDQAGGDPVRAEHLRKAHFKRLALKSVQARRKKAAS